MRHMSIIPSNHAVRRKVGGGSALTQPDEISGGLFWWDFSDATTLYTDNALSTAVSSDGDAIGSADNKFNLGTDYLRQGTASKKPTYKTGIVNSKSVARFDGGDGFETSATIDLTSTSALTIFAVTNGQPGQDDVIMEYSTNYNSGGNNDGRFILYSADAGFLPTASHEEDGYSTFKHSTGYDSAAHYVSAVYDMALSSGETTVWLDGTSAGTQTQDTNNSGTFSSGHRIYVGSRATTSLFWPADICELIVYNSALSTADRQAIEAYLADKWAI